MEEINKLNELGDDISDTDEQSHQSNQPKQVFDKGEQEINYNGLEIHFTLTTPGEACELFLWLRDRLKDPKETGGSYLN